MEGFDALFGPFKNYFFLGAGFGAFLESCFLGSALVA